MSLITTMFSLPLIAAGALPVLASGVSSMVGGLFGGFMARSARRSAEKKRQAAEARLAQLEANRQEITNPYSEAMNLVTNPFANLSVSTQAAEYQAEQADVSLANTLDTLQSTGAGAGGATALARAALQSKRGIAASIAQQESRNQQLRAQGQAAMEKQLAMFSGAGNKFMFDAREKRELQQLNRQSSLVSSYSQQEAQYRSQEGAMFGEALGGLGSFAIGGGFKALRGMLGGGGERPPLTTSQKIVSDRITAESDQYAEDMELEEIEDFTLGLEEEEDES